VRRQRGSVHNYVIRIFVSPVLPVCLTGLGMDRYSRCLEMRPATS